jgi:2,3-bisphosphoglycerate-independent phosphoglycerate mutase
MNDKKPDLKKFVKTSRPRPAVLMVIDGFGIAPDSEGNAVSRAKMPAFELLKQRYPVVTLKASGETVGLMWGEMGNSEVGHLTIGSGRVYFQSLPRIERSIDEGSFFQLPQLLEAAEHVNKSGGTLHIMGIMSSGKVHGYNNHAYALMDFAKRQKIKDVAIHAILDGRDTLYNAGIDFISELETKIKEMKIGYIASLAGRFYAMDRDNRWDRTEKAYNAIAKGESTNKATEALEAIRSSYAKEVFDEEFIPTVITNKKGESLAKVKEGDSVIFFNFRPDRARQLTKAFTLPEFEKFGRDYIKDLHFTTMTEYEKNLPAQVLFRSENLKNTLAEVLSDAGLVQLHIAETEKYAHVTFFFNGQKEDPFPHEDRVIIPSPQVSSYDEKPEMSTYELTDRVLKEIANDNHDAIIMNFAAPDMVAHTGNFEATIKAHEAVDECVAKIVSAVLDKDGFVLITADHGNSEELMNLQTNEKDKEHSTNPVPLYIIGNQFEGKSGIAGDPPNGDLAMMPPVGMLADVAPTMLAILGLTQPPEMTGSPLIDLND